MHFNNSNVYNFYDNRFIRDMLRISKHITNHNVYIKLSFFNQISHGKRYSKD